MQLVVGVAAQSLALSKVRSRSVCILDPKVLGQLQCVLEMPKNLSQYVEELELGIWLCSLSIFVKGAHNTGITFDYNCM